MVAELRNKESKTVCEELVNTIKSAVTTEQGVALHCVLLCKVTPTLLICLWLFLFPKSHCLICQSVLKDRTVPITTSGKIARRWCRRAYDSDSLSVIHRWEDSVNSQHSNVARPSGEGQADDSEGVDAVDASVLDDK